MTDAIRFGGRRAAAIENADLHLVVLEEGGHLAALVDKRTGVSPLWVPPWPSIEPSAYGAADAPRYGGGAEGRLLAGIMGHNLCLDIFGGPSDAEAAAGLTVHGEASVATYQLEGAGARLTMRATLPMAQLAVERRLDLHGRQLRVRETVENLTGTDRPVGWTQHVTLGPPFLEKGVTQFRASATRSRVHESRFGPSDTLLPGRDFDWPGAPRLDGGLEDLQVFTGAGSSSAYTAHLMDPTRPEAYVLAFSPTAGLVFGCVWRPADFPWLGIWEENHSRPQPPWNGLTLTRGLEFGVSPFPETRQAMIDRGRLFDTPTYRWIPARTRVEVEYRMVLAPADGVPERLTWDAMDEPPDDGPSRLSPDKIKRSTPAGAGSESTPPSGPQLRGSH
jgi:hypothetical protein